MATIATGQLGGWRFGLHPAAAGALVRTLDRRELELGDALRLEMETPGSPDVVHVQYFIATTSGGWAMWISCPPDDIADRDATVAAIKSPEDSTAAV